MAEADQNKPVCPVTPVEEEEGLVDPQEKFRKICRKTKECSRLFEELQACNDRVNSRTKTAETCMEEVIDFVHCVDHCAAKKFFPLLK
ncbi:cytochrome b-c1 complex subunit 6, mitochondrial [Folsomia candida]|uniref:cytochrome b-c1 complex subunit 6, mitochondrial n=1 Tax=Folsomia candida TaxID=158441 RepID=UPI000B905AAE|nr:cytochrome b-c1 complex subunit 6, mitochondrial [Folsomia candida]